jgi:hypothetical protein
MRLAKTAVGVAGLLACLIVGASVALGAGSSATPAGGRIQLFVQPGNGQGTGKILFTGAVGDYGSSSPTESSGANKFGVATLKKGTIKIDLTAISAKVNKGPGAIFDAATCTYYLSETAPAPILSGTGAYAGIQGTIRLTETFGFIGSCYKSGPKKGKCNQSNNAPAVAQMGFVYGSGSVSF